MRKVKTIFVCFFQVNLANLLKYQSHLADLLVSGWVQRAQLCKMTHTRTIWTKLDFYSTRNVVNPLLPTDKKKHIRNSHELYTF